MMLARSKHRMLVLATLATLCSSLYCGSGASDRPARPAAAVQAPLQQPAGSSLRSTAVSQAREPASPLGAPDVADPARRLRPTAGLDVADEERWRGEPIADLQARSRQLRIQAAELTNESNELLSRIDAATHRGDHATAAVHRDSLRERIAERQRVAARLAVVGLLRLEREARWTGDEDNR